jgi:hypothetical protein
MSGNGEGTKPEPDKMQSQSTKLLLLAWQWVKEETTAPQTLVRWLETPRRMAGRLMEWLWVW